MRRFSTACAFIAPSSLTHVLHLYPRRGGHGAIDEQVTEQDAALIDLVALEVADPCLVQHRVIDEELPGARACGAAQNDVRGVRHDLRRARAAQHLFPAE